MVTQTADRRFGALGRMGMVAAIHVAALFVIGRSLGIVPTIGEDPPPPPIKARLLEPPPRIDQPPPTVDPPLAWQNIHIETPDIPPVETDPPPFVVDRGPPDIPIGPGRADVEPDMLVAPRNDPRHPLSQPPYPASYIRQGIEGNVDVEIFVQPNGRVGDARIVRSSGYDLFDRAALDEARRNWRLLPATRNGEPYAQWYRLRVVFKLKNQP